VRYLVGLLLLLVGCGYSPTAPEKVESMSLFSESRTRPVQQSCKWEPTGFPPPCVWVQEIGDQVVVAFPTKLIESHPPDIRHGRDNIGTEVRLYFDGGYLWQSGVTVDHYQVRTHQPNRQLQYVYIGGYGLYKGELVWAR
jgi:hypothetical protein